MLWALGIMVSASPEGLRPPRPAAVPRAEPQRLNRRPACARACACSSPQLSRLVRLSSGRRAGQQALVPWADLLNHSARSAAHLDWRDATTSAADGAGAGEGGGVVLEADRDYAPGQQICESLPPSRNCLAVCAACQRHRRLAEARTGGAGRDTESGGRTSVNRLWACTWHSRPGEWGNGGTPRRTPWGEAACACAAADISYGERASGDLLLSYGFAPLDDNPHESVQLSVGLVAADPDLVRRCRRCCGPALPGRGDSRGCGGQDGGCGAGLAAHRGAGCFRPCPGAPPLASFGRTGWGWVQEWMRWPSRTGAVGSVGAAVERGAGCFRPCPGAPPLASLQCSFCDGGGVWG